MKKVLSFMLIFAIMLGLSACCIPTNPQTAVVPDDSAPTSNSENIGTASAVITLSVYSVTMNVGETYQLYSVINTEKFVSWRSTNEDVVLVNSQGSLTAVGEGVANVVCYAEGAVEASCTVTVVAPEGTQEPDVPVTTEPAYSNTTSSGDDFIFPNSSYAYLSGTQVYNMLNSLDKYSPTGNYAQDAINEIYARNGYVFKDAALAAYYSEMIWYMPDPTFELSELNFYEQENILLLQGFL